MLSLEDNYDEYIPDYREKRNCRGRKLWVAIILVALLVALAASLTLGLIVSNNRSVGTGDDPFNAANFNNSIQFTDPPVVITTEDVADYFERERVSSRSDLEQPGTPQYMAAQWLVEEDSGENSVPERSVKDENDNSGYLFLAKYVMALNYYALGGENWTNSHNFLSDAGICSWNGGLTADANLSAVTSGDYGGVLCDGETGLPIALDLGT